MMLTGIYKCYNKPSYKKKNLTIKLRHELQTEMSIIESQSNNRTRESCVSPSYLAADSQKLQVLLLVCSPPRDFQTLSSFPHSRRCPLFSFCRLHKRPLCLQGRCFPTLFWFFFKRTEADKWWLNKLTGEFSEKHRGHADVDCLLKRKNRKKRRSHNQLDCYDNPLSLEIRNLLIGCSGTKQRATRVKLRKSMTKRQTWYKNFLLVQTTRSIHQALEVAIEICWNATFRWEPERNCSLLLASYCWVTYHGRKWNGQSYIAQLDLPGLFCSHFNPRHI